MDQNNRQPECYADWLNLQLHVLWCYDHTVAAEPNRATKSIYWGCNSAWLVRSGFAQVERNGISYRANAGEWLIVPKGTFSRSFAESTHLLSVGYNAQWPDGQLLFDDGLPLVINAVAVPDLEKKAKQLTGLTAMPTSKWDTRKEPVSCRTFLQLNAAAGNWFVTLLDVLASHCVYPNGRQDMDPRVLNAIRILDAYPLDKPLDQQAIAAQSGLSLVHLVRLFRRELHTTPRDYLEGRRVEQAIKRLNLPNASPKEIAYDLGFKHLSHFSTWFKKITGTAPRQYMYTLQQSIATCSGLREP